MLLITKKQVELKIKEEFRKLPVLECKKRERYF